MKGSKGGVFECLVFFLQFLDQLFSFLVSAEQAFDDLGHLLLVELELLNHRVVQPFLHIVELILYLFVAGLQCRHCLLDFPHLLSNRLHLARLNGIFGLFEAVPIEIAICRLLELSHHLGALGQRGLYELLGTLWLGLKDVLLGLLLELDWLLDVDEVVD